MVIIPRVGALIRRSSGEIVFSDLMRRDDGSLAKATATACGLTEEQASTIVAGYSSEIAGNLALTGSAAITGLGTIVRHDDGSFSFVPDTAGNGTVQDDTASTQPQMSPADAPMPEHRGGMDTADDESDDTNRCKTPSSETTDACLQDTTDRDSHVPHESHSAGSARSTVSEEHDTAAQHAGNTHVHPSPKSDKVRLRSVLYGERSEDEEQEATTSQREAPQAAYRTSTTHAQGADTAATPPAWRAAATSGDNQAYVPHVNIRHPKKRHVDSVLILAIIALVITLGILAYGQITKQRLDKGHTELIINPDAEAADTAADDAAASGNAD